METQKNYNSNIHNDERSPEWYEKEAKGFLIKHPRKICVVFCLIWGIFLFILPWLMYTFLILSLEINGMSNDLLFVCISFIVALAALCAIFILSFYNAVLPMRSSLKHIDEWGNRQEIYRTICMEFLDETHPPKKEMQLWATPHFILTGPQSIMPVLYYLPALTGKKHSPLQGDVLYFSDGRKFAYRNVRKKSRKLVDEALAGYQVPTISR